MPQTLIDIKLRPNVQTEKVDGWNILRILKASALYMNGTYIQITDGKHIIKTFIDAGVNMKGKNKFDLSRHETFNSFRFKANGTIYCNGGNFDLWFELLDPNYNAVGVIRNDYGNGHKTPGLSMDIDWHLDLEATYFRNEDGKNVILVNGHYMYNRTGWNSHENTSMVPISGEIQTGENKVYMDIRSLNNDDKMYIKDISIDFVE